ncbi:MAG TPA: hypothetical protein P5526_05045 [Anaerolineae bacterium]|nr:hypothetical protein [Anaerolineae bacterium]
MTLRIKLMAADLMNNQKARAIAILGLMIIAALAGGAPHDNAG